MALFDRNRFRALGALVVCGGLMGVGGEVIGGHEDDEHADFTLSGGAVGVSITYGTTTQATYTLGAGTFDPTTLGAITSGFASNTFILMTDITGDNPALTLGGAFINTGDSGEFQLNTGGVVSGVAFSDQAPTGGAVHLQNIDTITIDDGGTVNGAINVRDATAGVTFNLLSGTITSNVGGSEEDDTFIIGPGITVSGRINGRAGTDTFTATAAVNVRVTTDNSDTTANAIRLRNVETITLSDEADTLALLSGAVAGDVNGGAGDDMFVIGADIMIGGTIDGGLGMDTLSLATGFTPTSANLFDGLLTLGITGGDSIELTLANIEPFTFPGLTLTTEALPLTFPAATTGADTFAISNDITDLAQRQLDSVIDGLGGTDVFELNTGATVASIAFSSDTPTGGVVNLQSIETITLDGGTVNGAIDAGAATGTTGVTFNLISGTAGGNITGSPGNDIFIVSGDITGGSPALDINGLVQGGGGDQDEVRLVADGVVDSLDFNIFVEGSLSLQAVETITIDGGTVNSNINAATATAITFNLMSGTIGGNVTGSSNNDIFNLGGATVGGFLSGGNGADTFNLESGTVTSDVGGGAGDDTFTLSGGTVAGNVDGGADNDTFTLSSGTLTGNLNGGAGDDLIIISGNTRGDDPALDLTATVVDGQGGDMDEFQLGAGGVAGDIFFSSTPSSESDVIALQNVEIITIDGGMIANSLITTGASTGLTINMNSGTIGGGLAGSDRPDTINLRGGAVNQNVLGNGGADTINLYSTVRIGGFLSGDGFGGAGGGSGDVLRYMGAPASDSTTPNFFAARSGLAEDDDITNTTGEVQGFESQENVAAITSLGAGAGGAAPVLRGAFGFEVLEFAPALNLYGAMSDALMQFGAQTAQGFALADLNLATGRATQLVSKDSPFTKGRIWTHKITHSGNGKGSIGLNLTGLTARAESDYNYEMSLTQHGFDAPLATTRLGAFNLRAVSHTMTGVIETNVAEAQVSGYGAGVALLWQKHNFSAHLTSLAGAYEVEAHTSPLTPRAVVNEVSEGSFSAINAVVSAGVADTRKISHSLVLRTTADVSWQTLSLDDFTETGRDGIIINFDKATRLTARVGAGLEGEHWFSDVVFVHETSSGGTLSSGLSQDYRQDDGTAIEMKLGGKIADLATGLTLKAYAGLRTSLINGATLEPSARFDLSWSF